MPYFRVFLALSVENGDVSMGVQGDFNGILLRKGEQGALCVEDCDNITVRVHFPFQTRLSMLSLSKGNNNFNTLASSEVSVLT